MFFPLVVLVAVLPGLYALKSWDLNPPRPWWGLRGLAVLCSGVSNAKTFIAQRDLPNGLTRRVTVGAVNELALDKARLRAADILDDLRRGLDPKRKSGEETLRATLDAYLAARKDLRPSSIKSYRQGVERYLTAWVDRPLRHITSEMVEERHRAIAAEIGKADRYSGTSTANSAMRAFVCCGTLPPSTSPTCRPTRYRGGSGTAPPPPAADNRRRFEGWRLPCPTPVARGHISDAVHRAARSEGGLAAGSRHRPQQRIIRLRRAQNAGRKLAFVSTCADLLVARRAVGDATFVFPAPEGNTRRPVPPRWPGSRVRSAPTYAAPSSPVLGPADIAAGAEGAWSTTASATT
jgi:hypothetical protein